LRDTVQKISLLLDKTVGGHPTLDPAVYVAKSSGWLDFLLETFEIRKRREKI